MEKGITIKINTEELDIAIKKASQLLEILKEIQKTKPLSTIHSTER